MTNTTSPKYTLQDFKNGLRGRCPACGEGKIFRSFLKVHDNCPHCGEELFHQRADDLPAYIVVLVTGHIFVAMALEVESLFAPPLWVHAVLWGPAVLGAALLLLQPVKGAIIALQWRLGLHGFARKPNASSTPD
ncbi:MAG: DUF983 domain-containing protein [Alphaproteobacteria bacterium]|nr:DUF983 domain-containing protein [Alphaproteobacteria bacterium]